MSGIPSQLVIVTEDPVSIPIQTALIIMRELNVFGVKDISLEKDRIFIMLSYTPNSKHLKRKFGNLPIRYMRTKIQSEEEFQKVEEAVKGYRFNLLDDEYEEFEKQQQIQTNSGIKRTLYIQGTDHQSANKKSKPSTSTSSTAVVELQDEDDDYEDIEHFITQRTAQ
ncbi:uncharacterized protein LOC114344589 [Diabrotica virgifera virgifera]|uniref:Uncharacterized protein LOC114344589 n=2 Tax=Diabrotica virgifera virgifera TaxID=50390 RepID=A0A6P7GNL1_DIAVI|nr:uncharacterized protein LOC114344589 [Diabrotica virgifera virgifera]